MILLSRHYTTGSGVICVRRLGKHIEITVTGIPNLTLEDLDGLVQDLASIVEAWRDNGAMGQSAGNRTGLT